MAQRAGCISLANILGHSHFLVEVQIQTNRSIKTFMVNNNWHYFLLHDCHYFLSMNSLKEKAFPQQSIPFYLSTHKNQDTILYFCHHHLLSWKLLQHISTANDCNFTEWTGMEMGPKGEHLSLNRCVYNNKGGGKIRGIIQYLNNVVRTTAIIMQTVS